MQVSYRFEQIKHTGTKSLPCPTCGKKVKRQKTFMHTINPFNTDEQGQMKTRERVSKDIYDEIREWALVPETCAKCKTGKPTGVPR